MRSLFSLVIISFLTIASDAFATASKPKIIKPAEDPLSLSHAQAVGAVFAIENRKASIGTGTLINERQILTAGHLFKNYLPKSIDKESGPVKIDISSRNVFWSNDNVLDLKQPPSVFYHAVSITVDAKFINEFNTNLENPDQNDVKSDFAILTLAAPVRGIAPVSIPNPQMKIPAEGLLIGYGKDSQPGHRKKIAAQSLKGLTAMGEWGIVLTNLTRDMTNNPLLTSPEENKELEMLMGKDPLDTNDTQIKRATQGDSGGPLLVADSQNQILILGIMSANSQAFNAFASLVIKTPQGYIRSPKFEALLKASQ
ncbi:MAG: trypsin-like serine protease [Alphaproteobacteria bacterium]|nr:trypsin-like serine protease [Alphaproteobacteria bacterium]